MNRKLTLFQSLFLSTPFLFLSLFSNAQTLQTVDATNNGPYTPQSLISNVFLGDGVDVTNIAFSGSARAVGYFSGGAPSIGIDRGIILTSGYASKQGIAYGPASTGGFFASNSNGSNATDANLAAIATAGLYDVAVYTITFIPTADTLRFRYCFASEEYPEYSCTPYNDIFGFFIQGPGYPTPTNIAKVPNTNLPVAINNIHPYNDQHNPVPNPCYPFNDQYYHDNEFSTQQPVYDGFTDVFTAMAVVVPCQPYTIKLAIADVKDSAYDSGVFLEARSFGTTVLRAQVNTLGADGTIAEGCTPASITFSMPAPLSQDYPVNLNMFGTATPGTDFPNLPANLVIPAGQTQVTYTLPALEDNQTEPVEMIAFDIKTDACHRDTVYLYIRDNPILPPLMQDTTVCTAGVPIVLNATVPVPTPSAPTFTNTQDVAIPDEYPAVASSINVTGVQPAKLGPGAIRSVCVNIAHPYDDDLDLFLLSPGGQVLELSTDNGGSGDNYTNTCFTPTAANPITFPGPQAPASAAPFTGNFRPEGAWSDLWDTPNRPANGTWSLQATDDYPSFTGSILDWSITFAPSYEVIYQWAANPNLSCLTCPVNTVTPSGSGIYSVTATDSYGCTAAKSVQVNIAPLTATTAVSTPINCFGNHNGAANVTVNVGGSNTFQWSDPAGQTGAQASNLSSGTYTVTVTNIGGCTSTASVTLMQPLALDLATTSQNAACFGQASGTATATVSGGTGPYQYLWSNGLTSGNLNALSNGNYTLTVTDAHGCTDIGSVAISQPNPLQLSTSLVNQVSCFSAADGAINLAANGGVQPWTYHWNSGQTTANISGLIAGSYTVTMTDGNGCSTTLQQDITQPTAVTAFATAQMVHCFGEANGALHLDVNGGVPGYTTTWQGPAGFTGSGTDLTSLIAGDYVATVTDQKGCTKVLTTKVNEPAAIALALPAVADTICFSATNGTATVVPSGGTGPFSYLWDANGQTGATATGLPSQEYHVTVTDANGCTESAKTIVPQKQEMNTFAQPTLPNCHDGSDGTATVLSIYYGITPANLNNFNFNWNTSPVQHSATASHLKANQSYTVTVSDNLGCSAQYSFTMGNPIAVEAAITGAGKVKCHGESTGWASANATGGVGPYTWQWGTGLTPTDSVGTGLPAGLNRVTITDAHGCPDVASVTLEEPEATLVHIIPTHVKCYGDRSGSAIASATGGTGPYSFLWWDGNKTTEVKEMQAGVFGLTVTDVNGCSTPGIVEIEQPDSPVTGTVEMQEPRCFGDHNGRILFTPGGGTPPYRYALDDKPFNGSKIQIGLQAGIYDPVIIDANGCLAKLLPIEVTQPEQLSVDLGPDIRILYGRDTQLLALVVNQSGPYQLSWAPIDSTWLSCMDCSNPSVYSLEYNHYFQVRVTDSLGCRAEDQVLVAIEKPRKVYVPTAFTPNGDFTNDRLLVHGQKTSKALVFRVYDRWGEMVYEGKDFAFNDENTGWDGTFRGEPMDPGVYVWVLEVEYADGAREMYKGDTTLIR